VKSIRICVRTDVASTRTDRFGANVRPDLLWTAAQLNAKVYIYVEVVNVGYCIVLYGVKAYEKVC